MGEEDVGRTALSHSRQSGKGATEKLPRKDDRAEPGAGDAADRAYLDKGNIEEKRYSRRRFPSVYTRADIGLLAEVDEAHETLSGPAIGQRWAKDSYPNLRLVLTRPIDWDLIEQQFDEMVKYATALRLGTAEPEDRRLVHTVSCIGWWVDSFLGIGVWLIRQPSSAGLSKPAASAMPAHATVWLRHPAKTARPMHPDD